MFRRRYQLRTWQTALAVTEGTPVIRCTCLYRASTPTEQESGSAALTVGVRDPFCPADDLHERTADATDADPAHHRPRDGRSTL